MTPLGWTLSNMYYETSKGAPTAGSIVEVLFLVLYSMREDAQFKQRLFQGFATMAAGSENEKAGQEVQKALKDYMSSQFPYLKTKVNNDEKRMRDLMQSEMKHVFKIQRAPEFRRKAG